MARPKHEIDTGKLKSLMRLKPTLEDTAAFFECSPRTIERAIRDDFDLSFVEFREQHMVHTRLNLVRKAIQRAESGSDRMLIFCLKNLCGWRDMYDEKTRIEIAPADDADKKLVEHFRGLITAKTTERKE